MSLTAVESKKSIEPHSSRLYKNLVPVYQNVWPAVAKRHIRTAIAALNIQTGKEILEVGVGTGVSLDCYPRDIHLIGIDLSEKMLAGAQHLIEERLWSHMDLLPMNAESLSFPNDTFDVVTAFHTISVVSDPHAMMSEAVRVCRVGGRILLINHFRSDNPMIARVVDSAGNITKHLGWRTDLDLHEVISELPIQIDRCYKANPLSIFTILEATVLQK